MIRLNEKAVMDYISYENDAIIGKLTKWLLENIDIQDFVEIMINYKVSKDKDLLPCLIKAVNKILEAS